MIDGMIRVVGLGGSMAEQSNSLAALRLALDGAEEAGAKTELFDLHAMNLPMYIPGTIDIPEAAQRLADATYLADGMIWASPLYHGTISGAFKNAIDWLQVLSTRTPPYLTDKII